MSRKDRHGIGLIGLAALLVGLSTFAAPLGARETAGAARLEASRQATQGTPYYIEFRARYALSYGHTFVAFGRTDGRGRIRSIEVAGLHPAGDSPVPWMFGHVVAVPSETGPSDGDLDERYVAARYRIDLTADEYRRVVAFIRQLQANSPMWHAVLYNCNSFVADIARFMGLQAPGSNLLMPPEFINTMKELNGDRRRAPFTGGTGTAGLPSGPAG